MLCRLEDTANLTPAFLPFFSPFFVAVAILCQQCCTRSQKFEYDQSGKSWLIQPSGAFFAIHVPPLRVRLCDTMGLGSSSEAHD